MRRELLLFLVICSIVAGISLGLLPMIQVTSGVPLAELFPKTCFKLSCNSPVVPQDPGSGGGGTGVI